MVAARQEIAAADSYSTPDFNSIAFLKNGHELADMRNMSPIGGISANYVQSILSTALQNIGLGANQKSSSSSSGVNASFSLPTDSGQLSPFAQLLNTLQQLQQSNPTQYQQVTGQIATNLQKAAQTAQSQGNTAAANQLNQLATDFTNASQNGQLPNVQDLAQAVGGHHHHHYHAHAASNDSSSNSSGSSASSSSTTQLLAAFQSSSSQNDALNPMSIIMSTLSNAGITVSS